MNGLLTFVLSLSQLIPLIISSVSDQCTMDNILTYSRGNLCWGERCIYIWLRVLGKHYESSADQPAPPTAVVPVCYIKHVKEPRKLKVKEKGLAPVLFSGMVWQQVAPLHFPSGCYDDIIVPSLQIPRLLVSFCCSSLNTLLVDSSFFTEYCFYFVHI